jgi:YbgC/YbaW family acyl-CoA thioester hydrolase
VPEQFRVKRRVQFSETDVAGLVHFSNFFRYFEDAEHELWRVAGLSIHPEKSAIGWPRVSAACEFHRPLKFEQEFDVALRICEMTARTIRYEGTIVRADERVATATWKIACVTRLSDGTMKSTDIPADVAERLRRFVSPASSPKTAPSSVQPSAAAQATSDKPASV